LFNILRGFRGIGALETIDSDNVGIIRDETNIGIGRGRSLEGARKPFEDDKLVLLLIILHLHPEHFLGKS